MEVIQPYTIKVPKKVIATKEQLSKEISSSESSILSSFLIKRYNPDTLVGKKGLKIYRDMKTDDQVKASLTIKKFAVLGTGWEVVPGDETNKQSVEMAEFISYVIKKMKGTFEKDLLNILTAIEYGYSLSEKVFGIYETGIYKGKIGLMKLGAREPFGYDFQTDEQNNIIGIVFEGLNSIKNTDGLGYPENPYPPEKFVIYAYNAEHSNPYGTSDLRAAYLGWWSKKLNVKWWNIFNERFGMPTVVAKYPSKGKGLDNLAIAEVDKILANLQAKSGFRTPDNITFELLEAQRQGKVTYGEAISRFDGMIARSILVPNLLGLQEQKSVGSFALGKKHFDIFLFVLEMLAKDIEEDIVGEQIIRPLISMNFGEVDIDIIPKFQLGSLAEDQTESRAKVAKMLADASLIDKREDWVREYLTLPERDLEKFPHKNPIGEIDKEPEPNIVMPGEEIDDGGNPIKKPAGKLPPKKGAKDDIPPEEEDEKKMSLSRELTTFEKKVGFNELEAEMKFLSVSLVTMLTPIVIGWREDILKKADKLLREKDLVGTAKLQLRGVGEFKTTLRDTLIKTTLDSKLHSMEELITVGYPATIKKKFGLLAGMKFGVEPWEPIPPQEALDFYNRKVIVTVTKDGEKKTLPLAKSATMQYYDKRAFTITGIESAYILGRAKLLIEKGIKNGLLKETINKLRDLFAKYIATGEIKDGKLLMAARLETIARTNINEAINSGRMEIFKDRLLDAFVPFLMWSSILDSRTSPYCKSMDARIFKKAEVIEPPAHFNCRSIVVPITVPEVIQSGGVTIDDWEKQNSVVGRNQGFKLEEDAEGIVHMRFQPLDPTTQHVIVRCPKSNCGGTDIMEMKNDLGTRTFLCLDCKLQFRVTPFGDLYTYDSGKEVWVRQTVTRGIWEI